MPNYLTNRHSQLIMNGERVQGLSDDNPPIELPSISLVEAVFGNDGTMYARGTAIRGGEVTVHLLPTSTTAKDWLRRHAEIQNGARIIWNGIYTDPELGYDTELRGGYLMTAPTGSVPGANLDFVFVFEEVIPNYDNAVFEPTPSFAA